MNYLNAIHCIKISPENLNVDARPSLEQEGELLNYMNIVLFTHECMYCLCTCTNVCLISLRTMCSQYVSHF